MSNLGPSEELGSWVCLYDGPDSNWNVSLDDEPRIDAGVSSYIDSGGNVDTLLDITTVDGAALRIRASTVVAWFVSTPETRRRSVDLGRMQAEERAANRQSAGLWDDDE